MNKQTSVVIVAIAAIIFLAAAFASSYPDGLEFVAEKLGFISRATVEPAVPSPLPDYTVPWIKSPFWSTAAAGLAGSAVVFLIVLVVGRLVRRR